MSELAALRAHVEARAHAMGFDRVGFARVAPLEARITQQLDSHFAYMESAVSEDGHFVGDNLTAADIMLSFPAEIAIMQGLAQRFPKLANFVNACHDRPAWRRARA